MAWALLVAKRVRKDVKKIPQKERESIFVAIEELVHNPYGGDIEKMEGEDRVWRRRIGSYRVFYEIFSSEQVIYVFCVERRTSSTY